jgi:type VI secretion system protein ImpK
MTDENDRTIFKQPTPGGDRSSARPNPGRRSGATEVGRARQGQNPAADAPSYQPHTPGGRSGFEQVKFQTTMGLNPLVNAASTLITVFEKVRYTTRHPDVGGLHKRLVNEIRAFEQKARDMDIKPEIVLSARYILCSAIDEAVMHTPWGDESAWGQHTLLVMHHGEAFGGEKCFAILERMLQSPADNLHMLELFYICLSLGFEGRFRLMNHGRDQLESLRDNLFHAIRNQRGDFERGLSIHWKGLGRVRRTLYHSVPLWVAASVFTAVVFIGYGGFAYWMRTASEPALQKFEHVIGPTQKTDS